MTEDRELVALLKAGNEDALEQLIMRWRSRAETYAVSILHDPQTAEDAVQEAFSRIYAARASLDEDRSFPAYPGRGDTNFVKRVVGLPGDTIEIRDGYLYVNGDRYEEPYVDDEYRSGRLNTFGPYTVPEGEYFVMGDHRNNSNDSRSQGAISRDMIIGHVRTVLYPFSGVRGIE